MVLCLLTHKVLSKYNLNFHPLEVQVGEKFSYLFNLGPNLANHDLILKTHFIPNVSDFVD